MRRLSGPDAEREGGFMLVEMLVVIALMAIVGGLVSDAIISAFRGQRDITARASDLDSLRQAMERTTRDMRAASLVDAPDQGQLLTLEVPGPAGSTRVITWQVVPQAGSSILQESESDTSAAGVTSAGPTVTVLSNLDASTPLFSYTGKPNYNPVTPLSVDRLTCAIAASPGSFEPRCIGAVNLDLKALLPGHPDLELTDTVQLRNVT